MGHHPEIQHLVAAVALCPPPSSVAVPAAGSGTISVPGTLAPKAQSCTGVENPAQPQKTSKTRVLTLFTLHPGGMPACSRWLSGAIPPEPNASNPPAPRQGCQPNHQAIHTSTPAKPVLPDRTLLRNKLCKCLLLQYVTLAAKAPKMPDRVATGFPLPSTGRGIEGEGWSYPDPPPGVSSRISTIRRPSLKQL